MPQSLAKIYVHMIFSTKNREPLLDQDVRTELYSYLGGALNNLDCQPIEIGGTADHAHILCCLSKNLSLSRLIEEIKTSSSRWIKAKEPRLAQFHWQNGYGAFSVSQSHLNAVIPYIRQQEEHHRKVTFQEEFLEFLRKYRVPYDERYVWD
jgi:REP element-mobilizing transposase RayT